MIGKMINTPEQNTAKQKIQFFLTFYIENFLFGIPAEKVVEITRNVKITPVPLAEDYILGIINLRGQIVTVIDLAKKLGLNVQTISRINLILIVENDQDFPVSFAIEKVEDILKIPTAKLEKPPEKISKLLKQFVRYAYQLPVKLVLILDIEKVLEN